MEASQGKAALHLMHYSDEAKYRPEKSHPDIGCDAAIHSGTPL